MEHPFFINGAGNTPRAEALRWLSIAEKLLTNRDLVGSKSFATRARESDPTLLPADQVLAIVDTLIAGDKRINNQHLDYYSILQIPLNQTHDSELVANQYRRLALLLNPQKNSFPFSDHAFRLVLDAWSVLSNAFRRSVYDKEIGFFINLNPVATSPPPNNNAIGFMQQPSSVLFQQAQSHPVSSSREQQRTVTFLQDPQMQQQQQQPVSSVSSLSSREQQQTVTFLGRNQTQQPVVSSTMLSPDREQQNPFTFGSRGQQQQVASVESRRGQQQQVASVESRRGQQLQAASVESRRGQQQQAASVESRRGQPQQVASVESRRGQQQQVASVEQQQGNTQAPQRNEGLVGNNQNYSATTTSKNVNFEALFGNSQNNSTSTSNVNNEGLFGNNQNQPASNSNNVNNEGLFGNNQNQPASNSNNVNNEGLFGNNQNHSASTSKNVNFEGLFGNNQNHTVSTSNNNVNTEGLSGNNQNRSASTSNNNVKGKDRGVGASSHVVPSFWTACPYCYVMYEYPLEYVDCTLRCQKCKRAFQAVKIASPPPIIEGKEAYFCCWGFMPLGFSLDTFKKYKGNISSWTPFAPVFNKHGGVRKPPAPRVYIDDVVDDVFLELSESSEESDEDWKGDKKKKKKKANSGKKKSRRTRRKKAKIQQSDKGKNVVGNAGDDVQNISATQGGAEKPNVMAAQSSKRSTASNTRRQAGRVTKDVGKLDLNVEFSNEVEEPPAPGVGQGNGDGTGEDGNIEGIEFFEGLDEFLSSLPILNAVGDDKVKAA